MEKTCRFIQICLSNQYQLHDLHVCLSLLNLCSILFYVPGFRTNVNIARRQYPVDKVSEDAGGRVGDLV